MKRFMILKIAAVFSAIVLVGGFVSYRAGAFDKFFEPPAPVAPPQSAPAPETTPNSTETLDPILMSTSKSAGVLIPPPKKNAQESQPKQQILPGSKSMPVIPAKKGGL